MTVTNAQSLRTLRRPAILRACGLGLAIALSTAAVHAARMEHVGATQRVLRELSDLPDDHRFHDVVDRRALARAIDELPSLTPMARRGVHDAVTVAVWVSVADRPHPSVRPRPSGRPGPGSRI